MRLSALCIRRPVATSLLSMAVLLLGAIAYGLLPISALPTIEKPTITVWSNLPGASPETVASSVTLPLEQQLGRIPGLSEIVSFSASGGSQITLQFELNKNIDLAANEVQAAINAAQPQLPRDMPRRPVFYKANPSGFPVLALALTSDSLTPSEIYRQADSVLSQKLSQVSGVAQVVISGAERSAVRVQADPRIMNTMGLSLRDLRNAITQSTVASPKGAINKDGGNILIGASDQLFAADEYQNIIVSWRNGRAVRLSDVATVTDSVINTKQSGWYGQEKAVILYIFKQPDANVVRTVDALLAGLPDLDQWLPPAIKVNVIYDRTLLIRASVKHVELTIVIATLLVVLVVWLFFRNVRSTLIPVLTIPVCLAATLAAMTVLGYSLNNLSLMALTIAIGLVVDDAIIVTENSMRLVEAGQEPQSAAFVSASQLGFTIIAITAALVAALIPILFLPDLIGRYFQQFGMTLVVAITVSAVVALTLTPMLCAKWLSTGSISGKAHSQAGFLSRLQGLYIKSLAWSLRHRWMAICLCFGCAISTFYLYQTVPKGFLPLQDTGILRVMTIAAPNISFAAMKDVQAEVASTLSADEAVQGLISYVGTGGGEVLSNGTLLVNLKTTGEPRAVTLARLRAKVARIEGVRTFITPLQDLNISVQRTASRYQYTLLSENVDTLISWADRMRRRMTSLPELTDVIWNVETSGLEAGLVIDRTRAAMMGLSPSDITETLYDAFGQRQIGTIYLPSNFARIVLEIDPNLQKDSSGFQHLYVPSFNRTMVPLSMVTSQTQAHAAMWVRHSDGFPSLTISFDTAKDISIGTAVEAIKKLEQSLRMPAEIRSQFRGEAGEASQTGAKQLLLFGTALIVIYLILGMLYESYVHPLTILSIMPSVLLGAVIALVVTKTEFTLVSGMAGILLIGMVMRNAILIVDVARMAESQGMSTLQSIMLASKLRFRPILMTTFATILGAIPLCIDTSTGYELRQPLGIALIGGLIVSQFITLYTTPAVYMVAARFARTKRLSLKAASPLSVT
jgi:hydrophobe/amphiphile efflux-1 (HAE1) family protein